MINLDCSSCTPQSFGDKSREDIFELFESLLEGESKIVNCENCGVVQVSKINGKLKINKINDGENNIS